MASIATIKIRPAIGIARNSPTGFFIGPENMVQKWHRLGFVVRKGAQYVETERNP